MFSSLILSAALFNAETLSVEDVQVTASRLGLSADKLSSPVTVLTAADLAAGQFQTVADALKTVVGFSVARTASVGGQTQIRVRGAEANQMLVILDGIELNDPAAGDEVQWEFLSVQNIARIDIIRSPLSSEWGSDALAGVIVITTKDGSESGKARSGSLSGEYGSFNSKTLTANFATKGDRWSLALGGSYFGSDGVNASRPIGTQEGERDGSEMITLSLRSRLTLTDKSSLSLTARYEDSRNEFDPTDFSTGLPTDGPNEASTVKTALAVSYENQIRDSWKMKARATWLDTDIGSSKADKVGLYVDHTLTLADGHRLMLAGDYESTGFTQIGAASPFGDPNQSQRMTNSALVAGYSGDLGKAVTLAATLRRDFNSDFADFTSWRVGLSAQASDSLRLFTSAARGQKAPTFLERFGFFPDQFLGNPLLAPETSISFEAGLETQLSQSLSVTLTGYLTRLENEIDGFVYVPATFQFTAANKDFDSRRQGIELTSNWQASEAVTVRASYSYLDATETNAAGVDSRELRRPAHTGTLSLSYQASDKLALTSHFTVTGAAEDLFFPPWPASATRVTLKSYILARIAATYTVTDGVSLFARVENGFNENYEDVFGFNTPGRAVYGGLRIAF